VGPEDVKAHVAFQRHVTELLEDNGEYVDVRGLTPARTWVRYRVAPSARRRRRGRSARAVSPSGSACDTRCSGAACTVVVRPPFW
jgi:hypothetical protein